MLRKTLDWLALPVNLALIIAYEARNDRERRRRMGRYRGSI